MVFKYYYVNYTEREIAEMTILDFLQRTLESICLEQGWSTDSEIQFEAGDNLQFVDFMKAKGFTLKS